MKEKKSKIMYKFILNKTEYSSEHKVVDGAYIKRFASPKFLPPPQFHRLYMKDKRGDFEIADTEKIDLENPSHIEYILTDGNMATDG